MGPGRGGCGAGSVMRLCVGILIGCGDPAVQPLGSVELADAGDSGSASDGGASGDCADALAISPDARTTHPFGLVQFVGSGGSGGYAFSLVDADADADLNVETGALLVGETADVQIDVLLEDAACDAAVTAQVTVVPELWLSPETATLPAGTPVSLVVTGGSGDWSCAAVARGSGAVVDASCGYVAGPDSGVDVVRVTDAQTGAERDATFTVSSDGAFRVGGEGLYVLPAGATAAPYATMGSGELVVTVLDGALTSTGAGFTSQIEGDGLIRVSDAYADLQVDVPVRVVAARWPELGRDGERSGHGVARALGDVNGDGYADAALGSIEPGVDAHYGGVVSVYAGGPDGLVAAPVRVYAGVSASQTFGRDLTTADLNGDGLNELIIGADKTDRGDTNNGAVYIYPGQAGDFFAEEPSRSLFGTTAYARFGSAVAACDFDADGWIDLAIGALDDADEAVAVPADEQGAVHIFRGSADGFDDEASFVLVGVVPNGADFESQEEMGLGASLAAGDFDGDGLCDLAAGAPEGGLSDADEDGVVLVYRGTLDDGLMLTREPVVTLAPDDGHEGEFGRRLAAGDIDGDGRDELAVSQWKADDAGSNAGAVWVFRDILAGETLLSTGEAGWSVIGGSSSDCLGSGLDLVDQDLDGLADLLVGAYLAEGASIGSSEGVIYGWWGDGIDATTGAQVSSGSADWSVEGQSSGARFGQAVAGLGDVDGDGLADVLGFAGYDSTYGVQSGAPWFVSGADVSPPALLDHPGSSTGHATGQGVALYDVDADGVLDLVAGAPEAGTTSQGANAGAVLSFPGNSVGWSSAGAEILGGHPSHSYSDRFGHAVASVGDFDGDGYRDLAVVARKDDRPSSFSSSYFDSYDCGESTSQVGAVLVYAGSAEGLEEDPAFIAHGFDSGGFIYVVAGGFDHDGDGYDDLVISSEGWDTGGGFSVVYGRGRRATRPEPICDDEKVLGFSSFDRLGASVTGLGDLDGDGCDELAVGASGEQFDSDWSDQGVVRVLWGHGGAGCPADPKVTTLTPYVIGTGAGTALAGGGDIDGDGVPDLVVGAATFRQDLAEVGAAWVVPGSYILSQPRDELVGGQLPDHDDTSHVDLLPLDGLALQHGVFGSFAGGRFGAAVAVVADPVDAGRSAVLVGAPAGAFGGTSLAGGVALYRFDPAASGLDPVPWMVVAGESDLPGGALGERLTVGDGPNGPVLLIGAPDSDAGGLDVGAVFPVPL